MASSGARKWRVLGTALLLLGATIPALPDSAHADANGGGIAAAIGLTAADGSVRTQAGVRLSISVAPGAVDRVLAMSGPVQARMSNLRACFSEAMLRSPTTEGRAEFELEAGSRGGARVKLTLDETHDAALVGCMKKSLAKVSLKSVPRGSRALVGLYLSNPVAALRKRMAAQAPVSSVRMVAGGGAESEGGTQAGEIKFKVSGAARSAKTIAGLQRDISSQLAGLLDCRRRAFRKERAAAHGRVELDLKLRAGKLAHGPTQSTLKSGAPQCVEQWLGKLDTASLADADLKLAISFSQP
ncbi:MAG: hypothetical protein JWN48_246 [Myxococcaceae bacterium]|nr:hypothetical protein [Myxococcaceae bacterium]